MAPLVGTWRLVDWPGRMAATQGLMILTEDGWYAVQVAGPRSTVVAEIGSYDLEDDTLAMTSEIAPSGTGVGVRRLRRWGVHGDVLQLHWDGDETRWHRALDEIVDSMGG